MTALLPDEVWAQLDPSAGRMSRRNVARLHRAGLLAALAVVAAGLGWASGLLAPHLSDPGRRTYAGAERPGEPVSLMVTVVNDGWVPIRLAGVGRDGPGLRLISTRTGDTLEPAVQATFPHRLAPDEPVSYVLTYRVVDCAAVPDGPWPVPVYVSRPWGVQTTFLSVPPVAPLETVTDGGTVDATDGGTVDSGTVDSGTVDGGIDAEVEWQTFLADTACRVR